MSRLQNLPLARKIARIDWLLFGVLLLLGGFSVASIYSATYTSESSAFRDAYKAQAIWLGLGSIAFLATSLIDYQWLVRWSIPLFIGLAFALVLVLIPGIGQVVNGARSWIRFPGFSIEPAEFCKLAFILLLALLLTQYASEVKKFKFIAIILAITAFPVALILKQPDLGSAGVFLPIAFAMMLVAGVQKRYIVFIALGIFGSLFFSYWVVYRAEWDGTPRDLPGSLKRGALIAIHGDSEKTGQRKLVASKVSADGEKVFYLLKPYQLNRIKIFYDPSLDPQGAGWTINQSLIAIGSGGWQGKGWMQGTQINLQYLPRNIAYNDFIYAAICEEWGFIGGAILILLEGYLLLNCLRVALYARDPSGTFIATGVCAMLFTHIFINIGMTIKVVPITGIPLPFISYGGTFLVVCMTSMGLVQSVWVHRRVITGSDITTRV